MIDIFASDDSLVYAAVGGSHNRDQIMQMSSRSVDHPTKVLFSEQLFKLQTYSRQPPSISGSQD